METTIQNQLYGSAGVQVSNDWLKSCLDFLREENQQPTPDLCMHHVLHSDLRFVVRDANNTTLQVPPHIQSLERMIRSSENPTNPLQETPVDFQLLVQLEEILDVSLNAEQRYNPQHYNKPIRSLKLCLSHGYKSNNSFPIVAQEVTKIPNLQTASLAGMKLLIHGKIKILHGILMLDGGNTLVCGGSVEELVQIQKKSIEKAKQKAGVGVDATIRALVNVHQDNPDEEEQPQDEAHEESRDVPIQVQPEVHYMAPPIPPPVVRSPPRIPAAISPNRATQQTTSTVGREVPVHFQSEVPRNSMSNNNNNTNNNVNPSRSSNPYSNGNQRTAPAAPTINRPVNTTRIKPVPGGNPYASSTMTSRAQPSETIPSTGESTISPALSSITNTPPGPRIAISNLSKAQQQDSYVQQNLSFGNFVSLLERLVQNRTMYESYQKCTFRISMKQSGDPNSYCFDIGKNPQFKKSAKEKISKYIIIINAPFECGTDQRSLACKLPSFLTESLFGKTASELRALTKSNRKECDRITTEAFRRMKERFCTNERFWSVTLVRTADEIFGETTQPLSLTDSKNPLVLVQPHGW